MLLIRMRQHNLLRVLNRDHPFVLGDVPHQGLQQRGLARAWCARDHDVSFVLNERCVEFPIAARRAQLEELAINTLHRVQHCGTHMLHRVPRHLVV